MIARIHVNQHVIRRNRQEGRTDPAITVKQGRTNRYCYGVEILGPSTVISRPERPLACGATIWIETDAPVRLQEGV